MNLSEKIAKLRKDNGLSQEEFAERLGVSQQLVSDWEGGIALPDIDSIVAISKIFRVSNDYLLNDDEPEQAEDGSNEVEQEFSEVSDKVEKPKKISGGKKAIKTIALIVAACLLVAVIIPIPLGIYKKAYYKHREEPVQYPYVLVHGLGGWGRTSGINNVKPYWGSDSGSLADYYNANGYTVFEASIGPISSTWDRACELYAQLVGARVDYGAAHAKAHGHKRYGRTYSTPLYKEWGSETPGGQVKKVNLVGHSFGGNTIRQLTWLLANGSKEEQAATGSETSPLFTGGKGNWVNSVTALCSPLNGSTLYYSVDVAEAIKLMLSGALGISGIAAIIGADNFYDFQLEQYGVNGKIEIGSENAKLPEAYINGKDNAAYDLSPDGCAEFNKKVSTVDGVYYFSYSYCTTEKSSVTGKQVPIDSTLSVLKVTATLISLYTDEENPNYCIDESWLPNDGLVNVVSAKFPIGAPHTDFNKDSIKPAIWNVVPTRTGHHGTVIGMGQTGEEARVFYNDLFKMIDALERT